mgnify:CR=1 FL=1
MSTALKWVTPTGPLGTIPESTAYSKTLEASSDTSVTYSLISGKLPDGLFFNSNGEIFGTTALVSEEVVSSFVVRVQDIVGNVLDRTFSLTVQGQDAPEFITPAGRIGTFYDGSRVNLEIEYTDRDPVETLTVSLLSGDLPPGISLDSTGKLSGFIEPFRRPSQEQGYDVTAYDEFDFDFDSGSISKNYEFTLEVTDGKESSIRTFEIFVYAIDAMSADNTNISGDNTFITADVIPERPPILTTLETNLGTIRADNYYAFKFDAIDFDSDPIEFIINGTIPAGLELDGSTGWLYGYLPNQGAVERTFSFDVTVVKANSIFYEIILDDALVVDAQSDYYVSQDGVSISGETPSGIVTSNPEANTLVVQKTSTVEFVPGESLKIRKKENDPILDSVVIISSEKYFITPRVYNGEEWVDAEPNTFTLRVIGEIDKFVTWLSPTNLGTVKHGETSELFTIADSSYSEPLRYRLNQGNTPPGTTLLSTGEIAGIFNGVGSVIDPDSSLTKDYEFTVEVFTRDGFVSTLKDFVVTVDYTNPVPQNSIYIKAMPPRSDRELIDNLLFNRDVLPPESIYRRNDPNFGVADSIIYQHAFGLNPKTLDEYVAALTKNHFNKQLVLGPIKTARALNSDGTVRYEVIYSEVADPALTKDLISIPKEITWPNTVTQRDSSTTNTLFPNSLANMRDQLFDSIGVQEFVLPDWMTSKQEDGRPLGFVPAWVIAYVKPGEGEKLAYRIREFIGRELNKVDFEVERYTLEGVTTQFWNSETQEWNENITLDDVSYIDDDRLDKYLLFSDQTILG